MVGGDLSVSLRSEARTRTIEAVERGDRCIIPPEASDLVLYVPFGAQTGRYTASQLAGTGR